MEREQEIFDEYLDKDKWDSLYNISKDAVGPKSGREFSVGHRKNISKSKMGEKNPMYGKPRSPELRARISKTLTGHKRSDHECQILSITRQGSDNPAARLSDEDVKEIRKFHSTGNFSRKELSKIYGVCRKTIGNVINRKTYKHVK